MRKLVYYVGVTIDGYIAGPGGEYDFFPVPEDMITWNPYPESIPAHVRELVGMPADTPNKSWDTVLMGRRTYEPGLAAGVPSPYPHMKQYVFSSTLDPAAYPEVEIVTTDPAELVRELKQRDGLDIWLCGGAELAGALIGEIDELIIKSYPVLAGSGIPLLTGRFRPTLFTPRRRQEFSNGTQVTWFDRI